MYTQRALSLNPKTKRSSQWVSCCWSRSCSILTLHLTWQRWVDNICRFKHFSISLGNVDIFHWAHSEGHLHAKGTFTRTLVNVGDLRRNSGECLGVSCLYGLVGSLKFAKLRQSLHMKLRACFWYTLELAWFQLQRIKHHQITPHFVRSWPAMLRDKGFSLRARRLKTFKISLWDWIFQVRLKLSSGPPTKAQFFVGNCEGQDWNFQARLKFSTRLTISSKIALFFKIQALRLYLVNEESARSFSDRSLFMDVCTGCLTKNKCLLFFQDLEGLTEVFGRMSAGYPAQNLFFGLIFRSWLLTIDAKSSSDLQEIMEIGKTFCPQW